ncbi:hypothetical protein FO519_010724, partial [Halicephalobus sp. NKZ332]
MFDIRNNCKKCGHSYITHMHVPFKLIQTTSQVESGDTLNRDEAEKRYNIFYERLKGEKKIIIDSMIVITSFVRQNAIIEYNTSFEEQLNIEIKKEKANNNLNAINNLKEIIQNYKTKIEIMNISRTSENNIIELEDVTNTLEALFALPVYGKTIRNLFESELPPGEAADTQEFIRCYVKY